MDWNIPLDDERTLSVAQFCQAEGLTTKQAEELWVSRGGPKALKVILVSAEMERITPEARRWWHQMLRDIFEGGQLNSEEYDDVEWTPPIPDNREPQSE